MEQTDEMTNAITEWQQYLNELVAVSYRTAQASSAAFDQLVPQQDIDGLVDNLLTANDRLTAYMNDALEGGEDLDAQDRLFGVIYGSFVGADALNTAAEDPEVIAANLRLASVEEFPTNTWLSEIEDATAIVSSAGAVAGGAGVPYQPTLDETIDELSDAAGSELRSIVTDAAVTLVIPRLPGAVASVLGGTAGSAIAKAASYIKGVFAVAKKGASRIVEWVVAHAQKILPPPLYSIVKRFVSAEVRALQDKADDVIGSIAAFALGKPGVLAAWGAAGEGALIQAIPEMPDATKVPLKRIKQVTRCRSFIDKWFQNLIALVAKVPQVAIGIAAAAAATIILVLYELWRGLHQLEALV